MNEVIARIADCVVELNSLAQKVSENDTVEFDVDRRLNVLETTVDDLTSEIEDAIEFNEDTST